MLQFSAFKMAPFQLALVWPSHIGVVYMKITLREQIFFRVATPAIYETAGPPALIKFFSWSVSWLIISLGDTNLVFIWPEFKLVLLLSFSKKVRAVAIAQKYQGWFTKAKDAGTSFMTCTRQCRQTRERLTPSLVLQPLSFYLQCCRFILFEQSPWVNFLFASVCVLFVADTVPGQQL